MRAARPLGLFLLAPLVGEWLLGNQPLSALPSLLLLAPMYGGGALLVREVARRTGRGWPTMSLLAAAYALLEEGPIDQMIYNPGYLGFDSFAGWAEVPGTGVNLLLVTSSLALHTVWSIATPIALVEAFGEEPQRPWLGRTGLAVTALVFLGGSAYLTRVQADYFDFVASPAQLGVTAAVIAALVVLAFRVRPPRPSVGTAPAPPVVGAAAFAVTSTWWAESLLTTYVVSVSAWWDVLTWCLLVGLGVSLVTRWSRRGGWGRRHVVALASGALLTYAWVGFTNAAALDVPLTEAAAGSALFAALAVGLVVLAVRASAR